MNSASLLVETKKEYTIQLVNILTPLIFEGFQSIYNYALDISKKDDTLMIFQGLLRRVPKWNKDMIEKEVIRIKTQSHCAEWFDDLIRAVVRSNILILSNKITDQYALDYCKNLDIDKFIHKCYVQCSREIFNSPYLFFDKLKPIEIKRNQRDCCVLIKESIREAIRKMLPLKYILQNYLQHPVQVDIDLNHQPEEYNNPMSDAHSNMMHGMVRADIHGAPMMQPMERPQSPFNVPCPGSLERPLSPFNMQGPLSPLSMQIPIHSAKPQEPVHKPEEKELPPFHANTPSIVSIHEPKPASVHSQRAVDMPQGPRHSVDMPQGPLDMPQGPPDMPTLPIKTPEKALERGERNPLFSLGITSDNENTPFDKLAQLAKSSHHSAQRPNDIKIVLEDKTDKKKKDNTRPNQIKITVNRSNDGKQLLTPEEDDDDEKTVAASDFKDDANFEAVFSNAGIGGTNELEKPAKKDFFTSYRH